MDPLTGRAFILRPQFADAKSTPLPEKLLVEHRRSGLWLAGLVDMLTGRVSAFAYDLPVLNASEFDPYFGQPQTAALRTAVRAARKSGDVLQGTALQGRLIQLQLGAGRLCLAPTDRRPPPGTRGRLILLEDALRPTDKTEGGELAALLVLNGQIVGAFTSKLEVVILTHSLPISTLSIIPDRAGAWPAVIWVSPQLKDWLASGKAARLPSFVTPTIFRFLLKHS